MGDTIHEMEEIFGNFSYSMVLTMIIATIALTWAFVTKVWPTLKNIGSAMLRRRDERNRQRKEIKALSEWKESTEAVLEEARKNQENVARSLENILKGQDLLMDAQKATFEVLTQMLACMTTEKDPEQCMKEALGAINKFLIHEHGRVQ